MYLFLVGCGFLTLLNIASSSVVGTSHTYKKSNSGTRPSDYYNVYAYRKIRNCSYVHQGIWRHPKCGWNLNLQQKKKIIIFFLKFWEKKKTFNADGPKPIPVVIIVELGIFWVLCKCYSLYCHILVCCIWHLTPPPHLDFYLRKQGHIPNNSDKRKETQQTYLWSCTWLPFIGHVPR